MEPKTSDDRKTRAKQPTAPTDDQPILTIAATPKSKPDDRQGAKAGEWLSRRELCDLYGISYQNLTTRGYEHGGIEAYLEKVTGHRWQIQQRGNRQYFQQLS